MGILAFDWAQNLHPSLGRFTLTFLILLRNVNNDEPIENILLQQHGCLKTMGVSPLEIKALLNKEKDILIMLDGVDEYTEGTNQDIDDLLQYGKPNCQIIASSRPGNFLRQIKDVSDEDVWITGFSEENVKKCATQYLGCEEKCEEFLRQADESGIVDLLHVPIILLMACVVFAEYKSLPSSKTGVFNKILTMTISRTTLKTMGKTALQIENLEELLIKLGKLAWEALTKKTKQLLLSKVRTICLKQCL